MMRKKKKWLVAIIAISTIIFVAAATFEPFINSIGRNELRDIALEKGQCSDETCKDGIAWATDILVKQSGLDAKRIPWCMATNKIYFAEIPLLNALKNKFANLMYKRCERDELTLDDANITIGEPHNHDHDEDDHNDQHN